MMSGHRARGIWTKVMAVACGAWLTSAAAPGCGDDGGGGSEGGGTGTSASPAEACAGLYGAFCGKFDACLPAFLRLTWGDVATCRARLGLSKSCEKSADLPGAPGDLVQQLDACAGAVQGLDCDGFTRALFGHALPEACVLRGELDEGAECSDTVQCASGHCEVVPSADCGVCASPRSEGTACEDTDQCAQGLVCRGGSCRKLGGAGDPCSDTAESCEFGLVCDGGKCAAPDVGGAGAPCDPQSEASCDQLQLLYCNSVSSQCEEIAFADEGQPCGYDPETGKVTVCSGSGTCLESSTGQGTCVAPAKDGGACVESQGPGCLPPAECTGGTCQVEEPATCG